MGMPPDVSQGFHCEHFTTRDPPSQQAGTPNVTKSLYSSEQRSYIRQTTVNLGVVYFIQRHYEEAFRNFQWALRIDPPNEVAHEYSERILGIKSLETATILLRLAANHVRAGNYRQAVPLYQQALAIQTQLLGAEHPDVIESMNNWATLSREQGLYEQAEKLHQRILAIREKTWGTEHPDVVESLFNLALDYHDQYKDTEAELLYQRALAIVETEGGIEPFLEAAIHNNLAVIYYLQGKYQRAEPLFLRAIEIAQNKDLSRPLVTLLNNLGSLYLQQARYAEAEPLYQQALLIREQQVGPEHPDVVYPFYGLANLYAEQGKYAEAEPL